MRKKPWELCRAGGSLAAGGSADASAASQSAAGCTAADSARCWLCRPSVGHLAGSGGRTDRGRAAAGSARCHAERGLPALLCALIAGRRAGKKIAKRKKEGEKRKKGQKGRPVSEKTGKGTGAVDQISAAAGPEAAGCRGRKRPSQPRKSPISSFLADAILASKAGTKPLMEHLRKSELKRRG